MKNNKSESRKSFISRSGKGILGLSLFSFIPTSFRNRIIGESKIEVKIHPSAVKRNIEG
ncbi:MAG: hypothetical protein JEY94_14705 [Melioribacteraceae bacterium]|nr:hypothetical protein [Melioribacteraceae bacterium]